MGRGPSKYELEGPRRRLHCTGTSDESNVPCVVSPATSLENPRAAAVADCFLRLPRSPPARSPSPVTGVCVSVGNPVHKRFRQTTSDIFEHPQDVHRTGKVVHSAAALIHRFVHNGEPWDGTDAGLARESSCVGHLPRGRCVTHRREVAGDEGSCDVSSDAISPRDSGRRAGAGRARPSSRPGRPPRRRGRG